MIVGHVPLSDTAACQAAKHLPYRVRFISDGTTWNLMLRPDLYSWDPGLGSWLGILAQLRALGSSLRSSPPDTGVLALDRTHVARCHPLSWLCTSVTKLSTLAEFALVINWSWE